MADGGVLPAERGVGANTRLGVSEERRSATQPMTAMRTKVTPTKARSSGRMPAEAGASLAGAGVRVGVRAAVLGSLPLAPVAQASVQK